MSYLSQSAHPPGTVAPQDAVVAHAVRVLQKSDDACFARWADICDDLFVKDSYGNTLLHWAAALGQLKAVKLLVGSGLDLEVRNATGATPLLCAAASCRNPGSVISYFLRAGACMTAKNNAGDDAFSLLEQRNLGTLVDIFELLKESMESCPRLYASSGWDAKDGFNFDSTAPKMGTSESLAKQVSTVRFKNEANLTSSPPSGALESQSGNAGLARNGRSNDDSGAWGLTLDERQVGVRLEKEETPPQCQLARDIFVAEAHARADISAQCTGELVPLLAGILQLTVLLYNELALDVYTTDEDLDEESLAAKESFDKIVAVLGERHDMDGERVLLVQWVNERSKSEDQSEASGSSSGKELEWIPLVDVQDSPCVQRYLNRFDKTYSDSDLQGDNESSFGLERSNSHVQGLEPEERDELERMLGMIPSRRLSPESVGTWHLSEQASLNSTARQRNAVDRAAPASDNERKEDRVMARIIDDGELGPHEHTNRGDLPAVLRTIRHGTNAVLFIGGESCAEPTEDSTAASQYPCTAARVVPGEEKDDRPLPPVLPLGRSAASSTPSADAADGAASSPSRRFSPYTVKRPIQAEKKTPNLSEERKRTSGDRDLAAVATTSEHNDSPQQAPSSESRRYQLSSAEQISYQKFLYQSAVERLRTRRIGGVAAAHKR